MTLTREELANAAWANDSMADEGHELPKILQAAGADPEAAIYVAQQRALRLVVAHRGDARQLNRDAYEQRRRTYKLTRQEQATQAAFTAVWLDGLATGLRAAAGTP